MPAIRLSKSELDRVLAQDDYHIIRGDEPARGMTREHKRLLQADSALESQFAALWLYAGGEPGVWKRNYRFDLPASRMEFDFAMPEIKVAVEINGGQGLGGKSGHGNWTGLERDAKKQNRARELGWTLFSLTTSMVTIQEVEKILEFVSKGREG